MPETFDQTISVRRVTAPPRHRVIIIGGGFAGLAAGVDLSEQSIEVMVLEKRSFLGGRAYSFTDRITGDVIDNGQHLMMGCYHHTLNFFEKIGSLGKLKSQSDPHVDFLQDEGAGGVKRASFKCPPLPAPFHLLAGLARLNTIGWSERFSALRLGLGLRRLNGSRARLADITVREWLNEMRQPELLQRRFWDVVALATLNEAPEVASADMFARVLDQAFLHTKRDSTILISRVGLSDLYTGHARDYIESRGGQVRVNAEVEKIEFDHTIARGVLLSSGEYIEADTIICAVPYFALRRIKTTEVTYGIGHTLGQFKSSPIVSINLWYDEPVTDLEFTCLLDSEVEWVFNKNLITGDQERSRQHIAMVKSGARDFALKPKEELIAIAASEMNRFFPAARRQQPIHAFVVREHDATISHTVGTARLRPSQRTRFNNFFLAGDWTDTGLPATIEGAVRSGQECARLIVGGIGDE